jgi:hypothetical protein
LGDLCAKSRTCGYDDRTTVRCVPVTQPQAASVTDLPIKQAGPDYKAAWQRLRKEMADLKHNGVRSIDPVLILRFMDYIEQAAEVRQ